MRRFTFIALVLALAALPALAQVQYGTIAGTVVDNQQQPLPGVTILLAGPNMQGTRTAVTDADGQFRFVPVPGGEYMLKFELSGFNTIERSGVVVNVGRDTKISAEMAPSQFTETITVAAEKIVVDTSKSTVDTTVEWEMLDTQSTSRHFNSIWYMTPGVPMAGQNNPSVHGSGGDDNAVLIDGVDTTDPRTGTWGTQINWDTIQEAQVQTGGYLAEFGRAIGGVMNLVTKSGGNQFALTLRAVMRDSEWASDPGFDEERGVTKTGLVQETEMRPNITLGGPILKDKLWFYVGYEQRDRERTYAHYVTYDDVVTGTATDVISNYKGHAFSGKLTWQVSPNHSVIGYYNEDPIDISNLRSISSRFYAPSAEQTQYQGGANASLQWYGVITPSFFMEAKYQNHKQELNVDPQETGFNPGVNPAFTDRNTGFYTGAASYQYQSKRDREGILLTGSWFLDAGNSSHQLKGGVEYLALKPDAGRIYSDLYRTRGTTPNSRYLYRDQLASVKNEDTYYAVFVQDAWRFGDLTLNLGIRAEQFTGTTSDGRDVVEFGFGDQIAPRLGFAWDLNGNSLHGSVSRFYDMPTNYMSAYMSANTLRQSYWLWNTGCTETGNWWETSDACWSLQWDVPVYLGGYEMDPDIKPVYLDEFTIGYDQRLSDTFAAGINYIWREQKRSIEDLDPEYDGVSLWSNGPLKSVTVDDGRVFETDNPWKEYQAIELTVKKRPGPDGFQLLASYSYLITSKGWLSTGGSTTSTPYSQFSGYGDQPDAFNTLWYGEQQSPHTVKVFATWTAPWKMSIGIGTYWNSGYLYTRTRPGSYGTTPLEELGSSEVGDNWEADLHIEQAVRLGPVNLALYVDAFNVFDNQQPTARGSNSATTSTYNLPTGWQSARQFGIGFKLEL